MFRNIYTGVIYTDKQYKQMLINDYSEIYLPRMAEIEEEPVDLQTWLQTAFDADWIDLDRYGSVEYNSIKYYLIQDAYYTNTAVETGFKMAAAAVDSNGVEVAITWWFDDTDKDKDADQLDYSKPYRVTMKSY